MQFNLKKSKFVDYLEFSVLSLPILLITGPFLPDLILTICSFSFLIYIVLKKKFDILNHNIFLIFLTFYIILLLSASFSDYKIKSLITSFGYIRFGLFILVIIFLINEKKIFIKKLFFILTFIFMVFFFDSIFQKFFGVNIFGFDAPFGRTTSFFGEDVKLGGYIARFTPLLVAISIYFKFDKKVIFLILFISLFLVFISGERTSFLMNSIFLAGYLLLSNTSRISKLIYLSIPLLIIIFISLNYEIRHRLYISTINQINITNAKPFYKTIKVDDGNWVVIHRDSTLFPRVYHMYFETAIKIFKDNILLGSGPRTYIYKSKEEKYFTSSSHEGWINFVKENNKKKLEELFLIHEDQINKISKFKEYEDLKNDKSLIYKKEYKDWLYSHGISHINFDERKKDKEWLKGHGILDEKQIGFTDISGYNSHPHNLYLQLISETGILGFLFMLSLFFFLIFKIFSTKSLYHICLFLGLAINLFPFMFSGNFFNNWLSILYIYPIAFLTLQDSK